MKHLCPSHSRHRQVIPIFLATFDDVFLYSIAFRYKTLGCEEHCVETEVKKSRFIAWAWPVSTPEQASAHIASRQDLSASHNCYAFKIGQNYRSSDDGEPGGTAGRPILAAIEGEGVDGVCVLVTRFFGGIKLGTGGLVRAYGGAARACLRDAPKVDFIPQVVVLAIVPFEALGAAYMVADQMGARRVGEDYESTGDGGVALRLEVEAEKAEKVCEMLQDASAGKIRASIIISEEES